MTSTMRTIKAPLFEGLIRHAQSRPMSFHVPGHRYGQALHHGISTSSVDELVRHWYGTIMKLDATELSATDDLHHPETVIREAQELAAACFGAEETYFLVGGSTSGNLAMLLTVCEPGDIVIVQRNVHKSVLNGLSLAGATAVFVMPQVDTETAIATVPALADIEQALGRYPSAKAVMLASPNYYGMSVDLRPYAELVHRHGLPLLVDEAHGAHYGFHPELPQSAIRAGADAVVQSSHKTLLALTMGAMLHVQGERLDRDILRGTLAMIQSSSPSFPIMASLDISRAIAEEMGAELFEPSIRSAHCFREKLKEHLKALQAVEWTDGSPAYDRIDPLRVLLEDRTGTFGGYRLQRELELRGCWAEMADASRVVLLFGIGTGEEDISRLLEACSEIEEMIARDLRQGKLTGETDSARRLDQVFEVDGSPVSEPIAFGRGRRAGGSSRKETVPLAEAAGRLSAAMITPYPPGIPIVYQGERFAGSILRHIAALAEQGAKFQGASDSSMRTVDVYAES